MRTSARARLANSPPVASPKTICWISPWNDAARSSSVAKVGPPHGFVAGQLLAGPGEGDLAHLENVRATCRAKGQLGVLFDEQDGDPLLPDDTGDGFEDRADDGGGQSQGGLIEQARAHHQRPPQGQHLLLAATEQGGGRARPASHPGEEAEDAVQVALDSAPV